MAKATSCQYMVKPKNMSALHFRTLSAARRAARNIVKNRGVSVKISKTCSVVSTVTSYKSRKR